MFATASRNFVEEVDRGGSLIPVSSLNDTIALLTVVVKKKRPWVWQKPKYLPTDFTLNDLLTEGVHIQPVVTEIDFIKFNGTYGDNLQGKVDGSFVHNKVNVEGKDSSKLQSSFGSLKKEELDVQKLLKDSKERVLDMSHCLIEQTMVNPRQVFGIVKERIVTTQPCSVIEEVQQTGQFSALLSLCGPTTTKVSLMENGCLRKDSNVTMEIPTHTTIAYALMELEVKQDGHFKLCLMSGTNGGFEDVDGHVKSGLLCVFACPAHLSQSNFLRQELEQMNDHFQVLAALPSQAKSSLLQQITEVISDCAALSSLQNTLDQICLNEDDVPGELQSQNIQVILDPLKQSGEEESAASVVRALHLILSAIDEMPNDCVAVLEMCCSPVLLLDLKLVVQCVLGNGELPLSIMGQATLAEEVYKEIEHLFNSSNVSLKKDGDTLRTEIQHAAGNLPLVLCIAVKGLASLVQ